MFVFILISMCIVLSWLNYKLYIITIKNKKVIIKILINTCIVIFIYWAWFSTSSISYTVAGKLKVTGCPVPLYFSQLEDKMWTDYIPHSVYICAASILNVALCLLAILIVTWVCSKNEKLNLPCE